MSDLREKNLREFSGFKTTPKGWTEPTVGDLCHLGRGRVISQEEINGNPGPFPVFSSQTRDNGEMGQLATFDFEGEYVTWTTDGENAGTLFYRTGQFNCTNVCGTLRPKISDELDLRFLTYQLGQIAKRYVSYVGNPKLMNGVMASVGLILPPLPQQRRIAEILGTVDEMIEQTEALIAKQQQVKAGLMHDLFTRGVTATGTLRPPPAEAPHLYQASPLGPIPKEWDAHQIDAIGDVITGNTPAETSLETGSRGIPFVTPGDVGDEAFVRATERSLTNRNAERARPIPVNSVCVVCIGSTIGKLAMVSQESVTNQQINSVVCHERGLAFFVYFSMSHFLPAQLRREAGLQAVPIVNKSTFSRLLIAKPREPGEAEAIQSRLLSASANIQAETAHLAKLRQQKQGLMHDLLTGRVPVPA